MSSRLQRALREWYAARRHMDDVIDERTPGPLTPMEGAACDATTKASRELMRAFEQDYCGGISSRNK